jgi:hypothetical protein
MHIKYRKFFIHRTSTVIMTETLSIEIDMPEFMSLMDANAKKLIIEETSEKIRNRISTLFETTSRGIIAKKLNILPPEGVPAQQPAEEPAPVPLHDKAELAEEILSLPEDEAHNKLKLSLARGDIDEATYDELKSLIEPITGPVPSPSPPPAACPRCGKELEPTVNFCRFCGAKVR